MLSLPRFSGRGPGLVLLLLLPPFCCSLLMLLWTLAVGLAAAAAGAADSAPPTKLQSLTSAHHRWRSIYEQQQNTASPFTMLWCMLTIAFTS
jgi:hypothetical protein